MEGRSLRSLLNASTPLITRVALGPLLRFNKAPAQLHFHQRCVKLRNKLERIHGMSPYLQRAQNLAELAAELQALALSQLQEVSANTPTFIAGVLPAVVTSDPVTHLWKLFQLGAPLCLLFNAVAPEHPIAVVSSDDMRVCKKSVYDFLLAVKMHLGYEDELMILNVFSDSGTDFNKTLLVVEKLALRADIVEEESSSYNGGTLPNSTPGSLPSSQPGSAPTSRSASGHVPMHTPEAAMSSLSLSDRGRPTFDLEPSPLDSTVTLNDEHSSTDASKVFNELVYTERKYLDDLELLLKYKNEVRLADSVLPEQLDIMFPNLDVITDFQRRFLNGLECNVGISYKYQRIGLAFLHAARGPFRAYEPWTIGQTAAVELLHREGASLRKSSSLIDPGFELHSYVLKPVQRLCKYPLLLKELVKSTSTLNPGYEELTLALEAMKEVAHKVNEAQRRAENVGYLHQLQTRVVNWKGYNVKEMGELLHHGIIGVKVKDEDEKEFLAYLFERAIFFFVEEARKKSGFRNKTPKASSSLNMISSDGPLELSGRVYVLEIYNISTLGNSLVISWLGKKESGLFTFRYKTEETRAQWESCLRGLKQSEMAQIHRKLRGSQDSLGNLSMNSDRTVGTPGNRHHSSSSTTMMQRRVLVQLIHQNNDAGTLVLPASITFPEVYQKIGNRLGDVQRLRYKDEDGDYVVMDSNEDWAIAVDMVEETGGSITIWVS